MCGKVEGKAQRPLHHCMKLAACDCFLFAVLLATTRKVARFVFFVSSSSAFHLARAVLKLPKQINPASNELSRKKKNIKRRRSEPSMLTGGRTPARFDSGLIPTHKPRLCLCTTRGHSPSLTATPPLPECVRACGLR